LTADRVTAGALSEIIASQKPVHPPGESRQYHGLTRGWIVNEVVSRVDTKRRTVGQFLREEIAGPLGLGEELLLGLPSDFNKKKDEEGNMHGNRDEENLIEGRCKLAPLVCQSQNKTTRQLLQGKQPAKTGWGYTMAVLAATSVVSLLGGRRSKDKSRVDPLSGWEGSVAAREAKLAWRMKGHGGIIDPDVVAPFNSELVRRGEVPSANVHASARALATLAMAMAEGGTVPPEAAAAAVAAAAVNGTSCRPLELLSEAGLASAMAGQVTMPLVDVSGLGLPGFITDRIHANVETTFTNAGVYWLSS
jgi:hypothetical protein